RHASAARRSGRRRRRRKRAHSRCMLDCAARRRSLMLLLIGAFTIGLILSLLAFGVFISFRIFAFPDITADGSITDGAAVTGVLLVAHVHPLAATAAAFGAGALAGSATGVLHTRFKINGLLSGIL